MRFSQIIWAAHSLFVEDKEFKLFEGVLPGLRARKALKTLSKAYIIFELCVGYYRSGEASNQYGHLLKSMCKFPFEKQTMSYISYIRKVFFFYSHRNSSLSLE